MPSGGLRVWGSLCPHTTSASLGSWSATPSSLLQGPRTALTTWTTQILLQTIPEVWAPEQEPKGLNPWEFPCPNNIFLASSEHSQLYLKCKGAEKTELLPELQNSTSIFFFFKAFSSFLLLKECQSWLHVHREDVQKYLQTELSQVSNTPAVRWSLPVSEPIMNIQILTARVIF